MRLSHPKPLCFWRVFRSVVDLASFHTHLWLHLFRCILTPKAKQILNRSQLDKISFFSWTVVTCLLRAVPSPDRISQKVDHPGSCTCTVVYDRKDQLCQLVTKNYHLCRPDVSPGVLCWCVGNLKSWRRNLRWALSAWASNQIVQTSWQ